MPVRSMTGFAQVKGEAGDQVEFTLTLKAVNHRFLDLHLRLPSEMDGLEMKVRRLLKERLARGSISLSLNLERRGGSEFEINRELVSGYVKAFRAASVEAGVVAEPDINAVLRMPGALRAADQQDESLDAAVLKALENAIVRLNEMRAEEGRGTEAELRRLMGELAAASEELDKLRSVASRAYFEKIQARLQELLGQHAEPDRALQEAALLAERSDIQEEIVRMHTHIRHFVGLLDGESEIGKKLDFLLQEMNRETNTLLSKTSGVGGEALRVTELGLAMKAHIEKAREQVQNIE